MHDRFLEPPGDMLALELEDAFRLDGVDPAVVRDPSQWKILAAFADLYEDLGLLTASGVPPLWDCCAHRERCWAKCLDARPADGGMTLPWIGPRYSDGRVVVLGMNLNDASGLARAFEIVTDEIDELGLGRRRVRYGIEPSVYRGSVFAYGSTRTASAVLGWLRDGQARDHEHPEDLADVINWTARLQTVKCSPQNAAWSKPSQQMWINCPSFLLEKELEIARPNAVIAFGTKVRQAIEEVDGYRVEVHTKHASRGSFELNGKRTSVLCVPHPRAAQWSRGHQDLIGLLNQAEPGLSA